MVLLHDLGIYGSLSYRFNIGPLAKGDKQNPSFGSFGMDKVSNAGDKDEIKENVTSMRKELKKCKEIMKVLETEYKKCEQELMKKTVEAEKLKTEVKDLREIVDLDGKSTNTDGKARDEEFLLKMKRNGSRRNNPQTQSSPKKSKKLYEQEQTHAKEKEKQVDPQFNCKDCYFQGTEKGELDKHITYYYYILLICQNKKNILSVEFVVNRVKLNGI